MRIMDALGFSLLIVGLVMTAFLLFGHSGPNSETRDFKIWEVPKSPTQGEKI